MMVRTPDRTGKTGSEELARVVRERRERLGMTRQDLSDATGIPYPTIAQIETAYRGVSPARLGVIARVLGLDPKDLYEVLATDDAAGFEARPAQPSPTAPAAPAPSGPSDLSVEGAGPPRAAGPWHVNPRFAAAPMSVSASAPERSAPRKVRARARTPDVVEQILDLLRTLPADRRLDALAEVQKRTLDEVVRERLERDR